MAEIVGKTKFWAKSNCRFYEKIRFGVRKMAKKCSIPLIKTFDTYLHSMLPDTVYIFFLSIFFWAKLITKHLAEKNIDPSQITLVYFIPGHFVRRIIGKKGANVKELKDEKGK